MNTVTLHVATNDWRNGQDLERFETVQFSMGRYPYVVEGTFDGPMTVCRKLTLGKAGYVRVGRLKLEYQHYINWFGNWCWDAYEISIADAQRVAEYLRGRGFTPNDATTIFWEAWEQGEPLDFEELARLEQSA